MSEGGRNRFAYADPPYPGQAKKHYGKEDSYAGEVDSVELVGRLQAGRFTGWALSTSTPALGGVLSACPPGTRVAAWVKPFAIFKPNVNPAYAWEPVLFYGGRKRDRKAPTVRDWVSANITLKKGLCGVKPEAFCFWLFDLLGMQPGDELVDLFPGSGAVTQAWEKWQSH